MLARATTRAREIAIRSALGASRRRLAAQLLVESLLIAALGGMLGIAIAWWGVRLLRFAFPDQSPPFYVTLALDGPALLCVAGLTLLTGILFGTVPALAGHARQSRHDAPRWHARQRQLGDTARGCAARSSCSRSPSRSCSRRGDAPRAQLPESSPARR